MKIDFANLSKSYLENESAFDKQIKAVLKKSNFIMGSELLDFENELQNYTKASHAITCSSGTDALLLALMALDIKPGDEIITTPFTFIATAETIALVGAIPVFVDIDSETYNISPIEIESKITQKTKAIIAVSLFGQIYDVDSLNSISNKYNIPIIEDGAQSFGASYKGKKSGNVSLIGTTSFFPAKPLGCFGDGGAVFTNDFDLSEKIKSLRVHGQSKRYYHKYIGIGGRLDTIQAAILSIKLKNYDNDVKRRQNVAEFYNSHLKDIVVTPVVRDNYQSVWAQYSIRIKNRDKLVEKLKLVGIPTAIHYPKPLHLQECFKYLDYKQGDFPIAEQVANEILSLPMNPYLKEAELNYITNHIHKLK
jgi:UDP-2-acetamido-2-deoxy-ribo-hexuluronate aminotransferase